MATAWFKCSSVSHPGSRAPARLALTEAPGLHSLEQADAEKHCAKEMGIGKGQVGKGTIPDIPSCWACATRCVPCVAQPSHLTPARQDLCLPQPSLPACAHSLCAHLPPLPPFPTLSPATGAALPGGPLQAAGGRMPG